MLLTLRRESEEDGEDMLLTARFVQERELRGGAEEEEEEGGEVEGEGEGGVKGLSEEERKRRRWQKQGRVEGVKMDDLVSGQWKEKLMEGMDTDERTEIEWQTNQGFNLTPIHVRVSICNLKAIRSSRNRTPTSPTPGEPQKPQPQRLGNSHVKQQQPLSALPEARAVAATTATSDVAGALAFHRPSWPGPRVDRDSPAGTYGTPRGFYSSPPRIARARMGGRRGGRTGGGGAEGGLAEVGGAGGGMGGATGGGTSLPRARLAGRGEGTTGGRGRRRRGGAGRGDGGEARMIGEAEGLEAEGEGARARETAGRNGRGEGVGGRTGRANQKGAERRAAGRRAVGTGAAETGVVAMRAVLSDEQQRQRYDFTLPPAAAAASSDARPFWNQHRRPSAASSAAAAPSYSSATPPDDTGDWWVPPSTSYRPRNMHSYPFSAQSASRAESSGEAAATGTGAAAAAAAGTGTGTAGAAAEDSSQDSAAFFRWPLNYSQMRSQGRRSRRAAAHSQERPYSYAWSDSANSATYGSHATHHQQQQQQPEQGEAASWEQWEAERPYRHSHSSSYSSGYSNRYSNRYSHRRSYWQERNSKQGSRGSRGNTRTRPRHQEEDHADEWDSASWQQQDEERAQEIKRAALEPFTLPLSFSQVFLGQWVDDTWRFALFRFRSLFPGGFRSLSSILSLLLVLFLLVSCASAIGTERLLGVLTFALMWGNQQGYQIAGLVAWFLGGVRGLVLVVGVGGGGGVAGRAGGNTALDFAAGVGFAGV
ncbi:unnamed protein product [Closterium sp. NIES-54]